MTITGDYFDNKNLIPRVSSLYNTSVAAASAGLYSHIRQFNDIELILIWLIIELGPFKWRRDVCVCKHRNLAYNDIRNINVWDETPERDIT